MKTLSASLSATLALVAACCLSVPAHASTPAAAAPDAKVVCEKSADDKKLHGAARTSHLKKCEADTAVATVCEKSADDKKLHGAARTSHVKKCSSDEAAKKKE